MMSTGVGTNPELAGQFIAKRIKQEDRGYSSPCWVWQLAPTEKGYGRARIPGYGRGRIHRAAYEITIGPIPDGLCIDHLCRVASCCNPDHLEPVTVAENNRRAGLFRRKPICKNGHPNIPENKMKCGKCRPCHAIYMRSWKAGRT